MDPKLDLAKLLDSDNNSDTDSKGNSEDDEARNRPLDTIELLSH